MRLPRRTPGSHRAGFTLIEVMVVIAIIALLAALGGPSLSAWIWKARLTESARNIERKMNTVRKLSMANNTRHCVVFTPDANFSNSGPSYFIDLAILEESAPGSGIWAAVAAPSELVGWTNDTTTEMFRGVSLEGGTNTDTLAGTNNCAGFLFNVQGFLENPATDFPTDCDGTTNAGASCARLTLIQKGLPEQRTLWVDRAGGIRFSQGPTIEPIPPS
ncbi:MAG: prepilin-type N-terminal cleavage/methylation domain-containing protein [Deltaproteobacteria bacterium]|nr:prepilin-type N-terminal cleavage/methylation domain-containing protein [Deltaproteobacteria bacterium]